MSVKRIILFGSGNMAISYIDYFKNSKDIHITIATNDEKSGSELHEKYKHFTSLKVVDINNAHDCEPLIIEHDVVVSLLPPPLHPIVARYTINNNKNFVCSSYISPQMKELQEEIKKRDLIFLFEVGLDPGIDHIVTFKMIDDVRAKGGQIKKLYSICGGLVAPESIDNPLSYKFTWAPLGVFTAISDAKYIKNGKLVSIKKEDLLYHAEPYEVNNSLNTVIYPNRDSLAYRKLYNVPEANNMLRATMRYKGFVEIAAAFMEIGLLDFESFPKKINSFPALIDYLCQDVNMYANNIDESIYTKLINTYNDAKIDINFKNFLQKVTKHDFWKLLTIQQKVDRLLLICDGFIHFGLFNKETHFERKTFIIETLVAHLKKTMTLTKEDKDFTIMIIDIEAYYPELHMAEDLKFQLLKSGENKGGLSSVAYLVGYPCAMATELVLDGKIKSRGLLGPFKKDIYVPLYEKMVEAGIIKHNTVKSYRPRL